MTFHLTHASVDLRGAVALRYTTTGDLPQMGSVQFSTTFISEDGDSVEQLGFKFLNGRPVVAFSFNNGATGNPMQRNYPTNPSRMGNVWSIVLPLDALQSAHGGAWRADLDVDGQDGGSVQGTPSNTITDA